MPSSRDIVCVMLVLSSLILANTIDEDRPQCVLVTISKDYTSKEAFNGEFLRCVETANKTFKLVIIDSQFPYETMIQFVSSAFAQRNVTDADQDCLCYDVLGVVGDLDFGTVRIIQTLTNRTNLNTTLVSAITPSTFPPLASQQLPRVLNLMPLEHNIEGLVMFLDSLIWNRIGLISDDTYYNQFVVEMLQIRLKEGPERDVTPCLKVTKSKYRNSLLQFVEYDTRVAVLAMKEESACAFLKEARNQQLVWPEYAWVLLEFGTHTCNLNGLIVIRSGDADRSSSSKDYDTPEYTSLLSVTSNFSRDSILTSLANSGFNFSENTFTRPTDEGEGKGVHNVSVVQITDESVVMIAQYNPVSHSLDTFVNLSETGATPRGTTLVIVRKISVSFTVLLCIVLAISFAFVSINLVLFVCFQKEPEIKATSFTVSLSMFLGCYLLLFFVLVLFLEANLPLSSLLPSWAQEIMCNLFPWLSIIGLPMSLIFSTLIVKVVRLYIIFFNPKIYRKSMLNDCSLLLYILFLTSPTLLVLLLLSTIEPLKNIVSENKLRSGIEIREGCTNDHYLEWLSALVLCHILFAIAVTIITFKTSKIQYKNFRGSNRNNIFTFFSIFITIESLVILFSTFGSEGGNSNPSAYEILYYTDHIAIVLLCQGFLFAPIVYPPLKRWFLRNDVRSKNTSSFTETLSQK